MLKNHIGIFLLVSHRLSCSDMVTAKALARHACCVCRTRAEQMLPSLGEACKHSHLSPTALPWFSFCCPYSDVTARAMWPVSAARRAAGAEGGRCFSTTRGVWEDSSLMGSYRLTKLLSVGSLLFEGEIKNWKNPSNKRPIQREKKWQIFLWEEKNDFKSL